MQLHTVVKTKYILLAKINISPKNYFKFYYFFVIGQRKKKYYIKGDLIKYIENLKGCDTMICCGHWTLDSTQQTTLFLTANSFYTNYFKY